MSEESRLRKLEHEAKQIKHHGEEEEMSEFERKLKREERRYKNRGKEEAAHEVEHIEKQFKTPKVMVWILRLFFLLLAGAYIVYYLYQKGILKFT